MNAITPIASGNLYQPYLDAARQNLEALLKLASDFSDLEFRDAADNLLTAFKDYAGDCQTIIDDAEPEGEETDRFWRDSFHAVNAGLGE
jgi:hypothetical protein